MTSQKGNGRRHTEKKRPHPHLRVVKEAWKPVGDTIVTGSKHAVGADLKQLAMVAPKFVWAFVRAVYMTAVALARMTPWVSP